MGIQVDNLRFGVNEGKSAQTYTKSASAPNKLKPENDYNLFNNENSDKDSVGKKLANFGIGMTGFVAGWEGHTYIEKKLNKVKKINYVKNNCEKIKGGEYLPSLNKAIEQNGLKGQVEIIDINKNNYKSVMQKLDMDTYKLTKTQKLLHHILRRTTNNNIIKQTAAGKNAFFSRKKHAIVCNFDKFGVTSFHELQHMLNNKSNNIFMKSIVKIKHPLAFFGPLIISACTLLTNKKSKEEKQGINDIIKNNCGLLTLGCMLPYTAEEIITNVKSVGIAKKAGVMGEALGKVKLANKISIISYVSAALSAAIAAWGSNKIRDTICTLKEK